MYLGMSCLFLMHQNAWIMFVSDAPFRTWKGSERWLCWQAWQSIRTTIVRVGSPCPVAVHVLLPDDSLIASRYLVCQSWEIYVRTIVGLVWPYFDITRVCVMMVVNSLIPVRFYIYTHTQTHFLISFCSIYHPRSLVPRWSYPYHHDGILSTQIMVLSYRYVSTSKWY
jgi:hypothetical protein